MTAKAKPKANPPGAPPHQPTPQSLATVKAMAGCGYSQEIIARHIGVSPPTLRLRYREILDNSSEDVCVAAFVNLTRIGTTGRDMAAVAACKFILACRAPGWVERSKLEIDPQPVGIMALKKWVNDADQADAEQARRDAEDALERARIESETTH